MARHSFDIAVIGGGPGGYVAAIRAAQLGMKACVVEREQLGGICLNWGCIPTKALLRTSEINHLLGQLDSFGFAADGVAFDLQKIVKRSRDVAGRLSAGIGHLMKKNGVEVIEGQGRLAGGGQVAVERDGTLAEEIAAPRIVLATGRAGADPARARAGRRTGLDLSRGHGAARHARLPAGDRIGSDRHRVREFLPRPRRRGDGGRDPGPYSSGRRRRNLCTSQKSF